MKKYQLIISALFCILIFYQCNSKYEVISASGSVSSVFSLPEAEASFELKTPLNLQNISPGIATEFQWLLKINRNISLDNISCFVNDSMVVKLPMAIRKGSGAKARRVSSINFLEYDESKNLINAPVLLKQGGNNVLLLIETDGELFFQSKNINFDGKVIRIDSNTISSKKIVFGDQLEMSMNQNKIIKTNLDTFPVSFIIKSDYTSSNFSIKDLKVYKNNIDITKNTIIDIKISNNEYKVKAGVSVPIDTLSKIYFKVSNTRVPTISAPIFILRDSTYKPNLFLLSIGPSTENLSFTSKDAKDFADLFFIQKSLKNRPFQNIYIDTLLNENATKTNIAKCIDKLLKQYFTGMIKPDDLVIIFISSHGNTDVKNGEYYISPSSYHFNDQIPNFTEGIAFNQDLKSKLMLMKCKKLILFDACHSPNKKSFLTNNLGNIVHETIKRTFSFSPPGILSSSKGTEYSYEIPDLKNGIFTHFIVEGVKKGSSDITQDGKITVNELYGYLKINVSEYINENKKGSQTPELTTNGLESQVLFVRY